MSIIDTIAEIACVDAAHLTPETRLDAIGIDSLDCLEIQATADLADGWRDRCLAVGDLTKEMSGRQ